MVVEEIEKLKGTDKVVLNHDIKKKGNMVYLLLTTSYKG